MTEYVLWEEKTVEVSLICSVSMLVIGGGLYCYNTQKGHRAINGLTIMTVCFFCSAVSIFIPIYKHIFWGDRAAIVKTLLLSIHNAIRLFIVDGEFTIVQDYVNYDNSYLSTIYSVVAAILFVVAPVLTFGFVLSLLKNISYVFKLFLRKKDDIYIFSELNEKSISLAKDIKRQNDKCTIMFTDVYEDGEERLSELVESAKHIGSILTKKDISLINMKNHGRKAKINFFLIGEDGNENLMQASCIIDNYNEVDNINMYLFSDRLESEVITNAVDKGKIKIRRINAQRAMIENFLYVDGTKIFDNAKENDVGEKKIGVLIMGLGGYGTEMLKGLSWFLQMDGYEFSIDCFDVDKAAESRFCAICPEIMTPEINGANIKGEARYDIKIHSGVDVTTDEYVKMIEKMHDTTYAFVALGDDERNIKNALMLRTLFERMGISPLIDAVSYVQEINNRLNGICNFKGQKYNIQFWGSFESQYSVRTIMDSDLEKAALRLHCEWGCEEEFWKYEYNYHSSVASVIHRKARIHCGIDGADQEKENMTKEQQERIMLLEHRRWNAYMRSEGYIYSGDLNSDSRNDLGKMHNNLVSYYKLTDIDKNKDLNVGAIHKYIEK